MKLSDVSRQLRVEDFPGVDAKFLTILNAFLGSVALALDGLLSFKDNLYADFVSVQMSHGVATNIRPVRIRTAKSAILAGCNGAIVLGAPQCAPRVNGSVDITVWFSDPTLSNILCNFILLEEGQLSDSRPSLVIPNLLLGTPSVNSANLFDSAVLTAKLADLAVIDTKLAALAVTTAKIADSAVITQKLADLGVTTAKLNDLAVATGKLADTSVVTGKLADLGVTTAKLNDLAVTTGKIIDGAITAAKITAHTITANEIAALTITASEIAALTITAAKIAANTITSAQIAAHTITAGEIAALTITANEIAANTITAAKVAADTLTANEIAANAIGTSELAANAVTAAKIASHTVTANEIAALTITAAEIAAGAITTSKITAGQIIAAKISQALTNFHNLWPNPTSEVAAPASYTPPGDGTDPEYDFLFNGGAGAYAGVFVRQLLRTTIGTTKLALRVPCSEGELYGLTFRYKYVQTGGTPSAGPQIRWLDKDLAQISFTNAGVPTADTSWVRYASNGSGPMYSLAPAGAVFVEFSMFLTTTASGTAEIWFDSIKAWRVFKGEDLDAGCITSRELDNSAGWVAPTLVNSWANFNTSTHQPVAYYKDLFSFVHLRGTLKNGTSTAFTLPAGFRPQKKCVFSVNSYDLINTTYVDLMEVNTDGTVNLNTVGTGTNGYISIDGTTFDTR